MGRRKGKLLTGIDGGDGMVKIRVEMVI